MWPQRPNKLTRLIGSLTFVALVQTFWAKVLYKESNVGAQAPPRSYRVEILRKFPHEGTPFTQGLEISSDGQHLVETSGSYPPGTESFVRLVDPVTGHTVRTLTDGLQGRFIEGIAQAANGHWFASTYMDQAAIEYDSDFKMVREHTYPGAGWGLAFTAKGGSVLATNGSDYLLTLRKDTFETLDAKVVTCLGKRVTGLNELEMVENFMGLGPTLLGNVYLSRLVLAVNPATAECTGVFNLDSLGAFQPSESAGFHACNGLAYNKTSGTIIATGKNWDEMFELRVHEDPQGEAMPILARHLTNAPAYAKQAMLLKVSSSGDSAVIEPPRRPGVVSARQNLMKREAK